MEIMLKLLIIKEMPRNSHNKRSMFINRGCNNNYELTHGNENRSPLCFSFLKGKRYSGRKTDQSRHLSIFCMIILITFCERESRVIGLVIAVPMILLMTIFEQPLFSGWWFVCILSIVPLSKRTDDFQIKRIDLMTFLCTHNKC